MTLSRLLSESVIWRGKLCDSFKLGLYLTCLAGRGIFVPRGARRRNLKITYNVS